MVLFIRRFVYNGYKRPLTTDDFWLLDDSDLDELHKKIRIRME